MRPAFLITTCLAFFITNVSISAQDTKRFTGRGIGFEYLPAWQLSQKAAKDTDEIALANAELDAQITVIVIRKPLESKDIADARKRIVDPWLDSLQKLYSSIAGITLARFDVKTEAGSQATDGVQFKFILDGQGGMVEAYWLLLDKKLVLVYMVRPDRTAEKTVLNWDLIRKTLQLTEQKK